MGLPFIRMPLFAAVVLSFAFNEISAAATLRSLTVPLDGHTGAQAVTPDGKHVVGAVSPLYPTTFNGQGVSWDVTAAQPTYQLHGVQLRYERSEAVAVSNNGKSVVGSLYDGPFSFDTVAYKWTSESGIVPLGDLPGGVQRSYAFGISGNGETVVGLSYATEGVEAFRWTQATGMVGLGDLPGGVFESYARAISRDGVVVVGSSSSSTGVEAFRWTAAEGMQGIGTVPGSPASQGIGVNADGSIIVGVSFIDFGGVAFRWTQAEGIVGMGDLDGGLLRSVCYATSDDGMVMAGTGDSEFGEEAILWLGSRPPVRLWDVLIDQGVDPANDGWEYFRKATGVSSDGKTIVGSGRRNGRNEAFVVTIPEPSSCTIAAVACCLYSIVSTRLKRNRASSASPPPRLGGG